MGRALVGSLVKYYFKIAGEDQIGVVIRDCENFGGYKVVRWNNGTLSNVHYTKLIVLGK